MLVIEAGLAIVALVLALTVPNLGSRWFEAVERRFGKLARRRALSVVVVGLSALALRAALLPILPIPQPLIQDEFAQLLTADTFLHGRLTNPTPHLWTHFESLFIILTPTYNAKYPPAPSIILAAGQVLFGHPFWGVWLSLGLMCGAICWMLQAWVGEGWALLGGFLTVLRFGTFSYWANSYYAAGLTAMGGALVLGALPRLKQEHRVRNALLMGLGLAILANSRPYEGLIFSIPVAVALLFWILGKKRPPFSVSLRQVLLPLCLLLGLVATWMGYYNYRVTGSPLRMPYQVAQAQYDPVPYFLGLPLKPFPKYRHPEIEQWEIEVHLAEFNGTKSAGGLAATVLEKFLILWLFYVGPLFTVLMVIALVALPYGFSVSDISPPSRFLLLALGLSILAIAVELKTYPHYGAPITCMFFAVALLAMRHVWDWRLRGKLAGASLVRSVPTFTLLLFLIRVGVSPLHLHSTFGIWSPWSSFRDKFSTVGRGPILSQLLPQPGRDVVLVRYAPDRYYKIMHGVGRWPPYGVLEWVYNTADIDNQQVIWAQDMGAAKNEELIRYYKDRRVWLLYADDQPPKLVPYGEAGETVTESERR